MQENFSERGTVAVIYKVETPARRQKKLSCGFHNISQIESHECISGELAAPEERSIN